VRFVERLSGHAARGDLREAVDLFVVSADAEAIVEDVRQDDPALAETLSVEVIGLGEGSGN
jgi:hypothetical protein